jgi:FkbM family methyltransferase
MRLSFSQFGEDLVILDHLITRPVKKRGIYVDAGCFDPFRFSNTRLLSLLGWSGLNVDANREVIARFHSMRPGDESICAALAQTSAENEFLETESGAGSRLAHGAVPLHNEAIQSRRTVMTRTLRNVIEKSSFASAKIDFLDIDCEGADFAVLRGFGIEQRRPLLVCIEAHSDAEESELHAYLANHGYALVCRRGPSVIYRDKEPS